MNNIILSLGLSLSLTLSLSLIRLVSVICKYTDYRIDIQPYQF